jgi:predicted GIY-YIG superfamily endonuclease
LPKQFARSSTGTMVTVSYTQTPPAARPLQAAQEVELRAQFRSALTAHDGVAGAHCIHEWWMRNAFPSHIEAVLAQLWQHAANSIPDWLPMHYVSWLPLVYEVAAKFNAATRGRRNIYLVRLDYSDRGADRQGIYVGMTTYAPAQRFDQHRAGIRAAGSVLKRGQELLIGPALHLQHIAQPDAVRIERDLAIALADAGLLVEGGH